MEKKLLKLGFKKTPDCFKLETNAGSGSTLLADAEMYRHSYGFEIDRGFYRLSKEKVLCNVNLELFK